MSVSPVMEALAIPGDALVELRVPKKLLAEQGAPTAADKALIQDGIEEITWVAALKPTNIGVPAFRDEVREYLEIAVLAVTLRPAARPRLIELIHRAIPYPVVLVTARGEAVSLSLAHKRRSQGEAGKVVIEGVRQVALGVNPGAAEEAAFLHSLALSRLPTGDLYALYDGMLERLTALEAARLTGAFAPPESAGQAAAVREGLEAHARLERELAALRAQAKREKQLNRRVELNLAIKRLEAKLAETEKAL